MDKKAFRQGFRDGVPIGLGYFAVAFSLGITAKFAGLNAIQAFIVSATNYASAGEYAGFTVIGDNGSYLEMVLAILTANCRYMLMSCALSQKFTPEIRLYHRPVMAVFVTDELFGINIGRKGPINPSYYYAAVLASGPAWAVGTAIGVIAGSILPDNIVNALGVALFGMFIAIIIPPAKKKLSVAVVVITAFILSYLTGLIPFINTLSTSIRVIIVTVLISTVAALVAPVKDEDDEQEGDGDAA